MPYEVKINGHDVTTLPTMANYDPPNAIYSPTPNGLQLHVNDDTPEMKNSFNDSTSSFVSSIGPFSNSTVKLTKPKIIEDDDSAFEQMLGSFHASFHGLIDRNSKFIKKAFLVMLAIGYHVYLGFALYHDFEKASNVLLLTILTWSAIIYSKVIKVLVVPHLDGCFNSISKVFNSLWKMAITKTTFYLIFFASIGAFLAYDTRDSQIRLSGLGGMAFLLCFMFIFSYSPAKIKWRPIVWGFFLQFCLGLLILRWEYGARKFEDASKLVLVFLDFTTNGTDFVYGWLSTPPNICGMEHAILAFQAIQVVVYFGSIVALLYYFGIMQFVLRKIAKAMQLTLGTTATESLNAGACTLVGLAEALLLIRPYLSKMTRSEIHAVMTSGLSCIAGAAFAIYMSFGACPQYLFSATVMSAPGSLACAKLLYPETEQSELVNIEDLDIPKGDEKSVLECISNGAVVAMELVVAICANLVVFMALLALIDSVFGYAGELVGMSGWSLELFVGYIFFPLAYLMGANQDFEETFRVASLMGTKTMVNEFVAYKELGKMINAQSLSPRSAMIATYALCGFSNFISVAVQLSIMGSMAPNKKKDIAKLALRALVAGSISCFWTAALAGIIIENPTICMPPTSGTKCFNISHYQAVIANLTNPESAIGAFV
ncbi:solute carrier family 28 member 3 [Ditylenchus destructor]|nr:solute carrier family 28 member 3 [Ditylenchus destructor]